jgi:predicted TIM-barrel fold metal-dependent hydrolase
MSVTDIGVTSDGTDIDFSDKLVSGIDEYRQAAFLRISHEVTFSNNDFGIDLANELGKTSGQDTLGVRASAAIMNDQRLTATLTNQTRTYVNGIESISLSFDVTVDETQETFSLEVLVANNEVSLVP